MEHIKEIIVVEGKSDVTFLKSFLDADIVSCNGSAIDGFDFEYLKRIAKDRGIIILTDPDYPGMRIRNEIEKRIPNCKHAFVRKENSIKHHKVGVAESSVQEVLYALKNVISYDVSSVGKLTLSNLIELNLCGTNSKENKEKIINYYHIGVCNCKTMLKRLNMLNISKEELKKIIDDK